MQVAFLNNLGEITQWLTPADYNVYVEGSVLDNGLKIIFIDDSVDINEFAKTNTRINDEWVSRSPRPGAYYNWSGVEWVFDSVPFTVALKAKRNALLAASDWTDTVSAQTRLSAEQLEAWGIYRQELRDFPTINEETDWTKIQWPSLPI